jgi:bisphosphoglycerate-independent phosphoglycerate mutase (AlkP superfamily)
MQVGTVHQAAADIDATASAAADVGSKKVFMKHTSDNGDHGLRSMDSRLRAIEQTVVGLARLLVWFSGRFSALEQVQQHGLGSI